MHLRPFAPVWVDHASAPGKRCPAPFGSLPASSSPDSDRLEAPVIFTSTNLPVKARGESETKFTTLIQVLRPVHTRPLPCDMFWVFAGPSTRIFIVFPTREA